MRVPQLTDRPGSLHWVQRLVGNRPDLAEAPLRAAHALPPGAALDWVSPRAADDWAEYRDGDFLGVLGLADFAPELRAFWPARGPQWDALGRNRGTDGTVVLVEAKAHAGELASSCAAESPSSRARIAAALDRTRAALGAAPASDWLNGYYQYANRLAHLHFLRAECGVPAHLLCVYFVGDTQMRGPATEAEWMAPLAAVYQHLGFAPGAAIPGVVNAFVPVEALA